MKAVRLLYVLFLLICVFCVDVCFATRHGEFESVVTHVYDGDTVRLNDGRRVRLAGIDTPEKNPEQYWAQKSTDRLYALLRRHNMRVRVVPISKDRYGRLLAELRSPSSGRSLNEQMVAEGMAYFYYHNGLPTAFESRLLRAQRSALQNRVGCWNNLLTSRVGKQQFTGNRNSRRFFSLTCKEGRNISSRNRVVFNNMKDAFSHGYSPARVCDIWPLRGKVKE